MFNQFDDNIIKVGLTTWMLEILMSGDLPRFQGVPGVVVWWGEGTAEGLANRIFTHPFTHVPYYIHIPHVSLLPYFFFFYIFFKLYFSVIFIKFC